MQQEEEFQKAVKRLKTEIQNPDFVPFKQVGKVKLKRKRISKKPLEYLGSGIGSSSAQLIKSNKPLLRQLSVPSPKMHQEPAKNVSSAAQVILDSLSQTPVKMKKISENPYKEEELHVSQVQSVKDQEKLLKQVSELNHSIKLKETFPNSWLKEVKEKDLSANLIVESPKVQKETVAKVVPQVTSSVKNANTMMNNEVIHQTLISQQAKSTTLIQTPMVTQEPITSKPTFDTRKEEPKILTFKASNDVNQALKDKKEDVVVDKYHFSKVSSFHDLKNQRVKDMPESSLPKYEFGVVKKLSKVGEVMDSDLKMVDYKETPKVSVVNSNVVPKFDITASKETSDSISATSIKTAPVFNWAASGSALKEKTGAIAPSNSNLAPSFNWAASGTTFKPPTTSNWQCTSCMVSNNKDAVKCIACEQDKPGLKKTESTKAEILKMPIPPSSNVPSTFNWGTSDGASKEASEISSPATVNLGSSFDWGASGTSFKPPTSTNWECTSCMVSNKQDATKCISCESDKPGSEKKVFAKTDVPIFPIPPSSNVVPKFNWAASGTSFKPPTTTNWECSTCMVSNTQDAVKCISCESEKPGSKKNEETKVETLKMPASPASNTAPTFNWAASGTTFKPPTTSNWECSSCMVSNKQDAVKCVACESDKPGLKLSETSKKEAPKMPVPPSFSASSTFNWGSSAFGSDATTSASSGFGNSNNSGEQSTFKFGSFSSAPSFSVGFSFGNNPSSTSAGFTFGTSALTNDEKSKDSNSNDSKSK